MAVVELDLGEQIHAVALDVGRGSQVTELSLAGGAQDTSLDLGEYVTALVPRLPSWLTHAWEADSLALADGDPVASWVDSVSAVALAQTTPSLRPTYRADLNGSGYPGLSFDGADDYLWSSDAGLSAVFSDAASRPEFTVVAVLNGAGTSARWSVGLGNSTADTQILGLPQSGGASEVMYIRNNAGTLRNPTITIASTVGVRMVTTQMDAAGLQYAWDNRTPRLTGATAAAGSGYTFDRFALGALLRSTAGNWSTQDFHAVYLYDGVATQSELTELWDYATAKWGTP